MKSIHIRALSITCLIALWGLQLIRPVSAAAWSPPAIPYKGKVTIHPYCDEPLTIDEREKVLSMHIESLGYARRIFDQIGITIQSDPVSVEFVKEIAPAVDLKDPNQEWVVDGYMEWCAKVPQHADRNIIPVFYSRRARKDGVKNGGSRPECTIGEQHKKGAHPVVVIEMKEDWLGRLISPPPSTLAHELGHMLLNDIKFTEYYDNQKEHSKTDGTFAACLTSLMAPGRKEPTSSRYICEINFQPMQSAERYHQVAAIYHGSNFMVYEGVFPECLNQDNVSMFCMMQGIAVWPETDADGEEAHDVYRYSGHLPGVWVVHDPNAADPIAVQSMSSLALAMRTSYGFSASGNDKAFRGRVDDKDFRVSSCVYARSIGVGDRIEMEYCFDLHFKKALSQVKWGNKHTGVPPDSRMWLWFCSSRGGSRPGWTMPSHHDYRVYCIKAQDEIDKMLCRLTEGKDSDFAYLGSGRYTLSANAIASASLVRFIFRMRDTELSQRRASATRSSDDVVTTDAFFEEDDSFFDKGKKDSFFDDQ